MSECLRSVKIVIEVDTNKRTVSMEFDNIDEASEWLDAITEEMN